MSDIILPQKCLHLLDAKKVKKFQLSSPYAIMEKINGWYLTIDYLEGKWGNLTSSAGREVPSLMELSSQFKMQKGFIGNLRFIFEGIIPGLPFHTMNGLFNRKVDQAPNVKLYLHDIINLDQLSLPFNKRYSNAIVYNDLFTVTFENQIKLLPILSETEKEATFYYWFDKLTSEGKEGIVAKQLSAPYHPGKRNSTMLKLKEEVEVDWLVVSVASGKEKYSETTGTIVCKSKTGIIQKVSGMSDKERDIWFEEPGRIIGKVVKIKAMSKLPNGTLYQPRYVCVREDKLSSDID